MPPLQYVSLCLYVSLTVRCIFHILSHPWVDEIAFRTLVNIFNFETRICFKVYRWWALYRGYRCMQLFQVLRRFLTGPWAVPLLDCGCEELELVNCTFSRSAVKLRTSAYLQRHRGVYLLAGIWANSTCHIADVKGWNWVPVLL